MMKKSVKLKLWSFFWIVLVISLFICFSYFIQTNLDFFEGLIVDGWIGMIIYVLLNISAVVVAPVTVLPMIVIAVGMWGIGISVFLTVLGWTAGSIIAFLLARKFGIPIVEKLISLEEIHALEEKAKIGNSFWSVLVLRMVVPVDVLSYALGLFSRIGFWSYTFATVLGIIPFCFVFAYLGEVPYVYQVVLGLVFLIGVLIVLIWRELFGGK